MLNHIHCTRCICSFKYVYKHVINFDSVLTVHQAIQSWSIFTRSTLLDAMQPRPCLRSGSGTPFWILLHETTRVDLVAKPTEGAFIAEFGSATSHNSSWITAVPVGFGCANGRRSLSAFSCIAAPQTELQALMLMSLQQHCTSPTTHAAVHATTALGWPRVRGKMRSLCAWTTSVDDWPRLLILLQNFDDRALTAADSSGDLPATETSPCITDTWTRCSIYGSNPSSLSTVRAVSLQTDEYTQNPAFTCM